MTHASLECDQVLLKIDKERLIGAHPNKLKFVNFETRLQII